MPYPSQVKAIGALSRWERKHRWPAFRPVAGKPADYLASAKKNRPRHKGKPQVPVPDLERQVVQVPMFPTTGTGEADFGRGYDHYYRLQVHPYGTNSSTLWQPIN